MGGIGRVRAFKGLVLIMEVNILFSFYYLLVFLTFIDDLNYIDV